MGLERAGLGDPFHPVAFAALSEQHRQRLIEAGVRIGGEGGHLGGRLLVGHPAQPQHVGGLAPEVTVHPRHGLGAQGLRVGPARHVHGPPDPADGAFQPPLARQEPGQRATPRLEVGEHRLETLEIQRDGKPRIGLGDRVTGPHREFCHLAARRPGHHRRSGVIHDPETGRNAGLERKPPQQLFAESVDGLDLQPARRLQRLGEQGARTGQVREPERAAFQPCQLVGKLDIWRHRPAAQHPVQPPLHL